MSKHGLYLAVLLSVSAISITLIPAYAEVTSLKTNASFYKGGSTIYFSGTILNTDPPNVTILVFDPTGKFILLASGNADNNHQFQIAVDTSTSTNQQKFLLKGTYNATAFIANKENGQTVNFVFSPDGSPMIPSPPTSLTASVISSTEIDLSWKTLEEQLRGGKEEEKEGRGRREETTKVKMIMIVTTIEAMKDFKGIEGLSRIAEFEGARVVVTMEDIGKATLCFSPKQKRRFSFTWIPIHTWNPFSTNNSNHKRIGRSRI